ncbi:MAG: hypothetical protein E7431_06955, partial [Ruminococcaceae bacterium]|nr:hypothetical protein [Oscillospiraceae bacterium]
TIFRLGLPNILMQSAYTFYIFGLNLILAGFCDQAVTALGLYYSGLLLRQALRTGCNQCSVRHRLRYEQGLHPGRRLHQLVRDSARADHRWRCC